MRKGFLLYLFSRSLGAPITLSWIWLKWKISSIAQEKIDLTLGLSECIEYFLHSIFTHSDNILTVDFNNILTASYSMVGFFEIDISSAHI